MAAAMPADMLANTRASAPLSAATARRASSPWARSSRRRSLAGVSRGPAGTGAVGVADGARRVLQRVQVCRVHRGEATGRVEPGRCPLQGDQQVGGDRDSAVQGDLVGIGRRGLGRRRLARPGRRWRARRPVRRAAREAQRRRPGRRHHSAPGRLHAATLSPVSRPEIRPLSWVVTTAQEVRIPVSTGHDATRDRITAAVADPLDALGLDLEARRAHPGGQAPDAAAGRGPRRWRHPRRRRGGDAGGLRRDRRRRCDGGVALHARGDLPRGRPPADPAAPLAPQPRPAGEGDHDRGRDAHRPDRRQRRRRGDPRRRG